MNWYIKKFVYSTFYSCNVNRSMLHLEMQNYIYDIIFITLHFCHIFGNSSVFLLSGILLRSHNISGSTVRLAWPIFVRKTIQSHAIAPVRAPICLNTNHHKHPQWYYLKVILYDAFMSLWTTFLLIELPYKKMPSPLRPPPLQRSLFIYTPAYYQLGRFCSNSPLTFCTL